MIADKCTREQLMGPRAVWLITGASSGIGRATALAASKTGARLVLQGRDIERLRLVAAETDGAAVALDLRGPSAAERLFEKAKEFHGHIDVVVNSAGIGWAGDFLEMPHDKVSDLLELNLHVPIVLARLALPAMVESGRGSVVFVSSIAGSLGVAGEAVYSASKAGVTTLVEALSAELSGQSVSVSVVIPGVIDTPFFENRGRPYDRGHPRPQPAERVAEAILEAVRTGRPEIIVPPWMRLPVCVRALTPGLYRRLARRYA